MVTCPKPRNHPRRVIIGTISCTQFNDILFHIYQLRALLSLGHFKSNLLYSVLRFPTGLPISEQQQQSVVKYKHFPLVWFKDILKCSFFLPKYNTYHFLNTSIFPCKQCSPHFHASIPMLCDNGCSNINQ